MGGGKFSPEADLRIPTNPKKGQSDMAHQYQANY